MELVINTFGTSLNRDNNSFVVSTKEGKQALLSVEYGAINMVPSLLLEKDKLISPLAISTVLSYIYRII